ncbi:MAG: high frequency lysogenization protein HflD [Hyphomonadaceae bacterium]|nr:high frequency lysogenization protein HflD [Hyphomonadaceae bacterium]
MMLSVLALGLLIGARHAFEPDHMAAVSSLAAGQTGLKRISLHGATWGLGHTITLFLVAGSAILLNVTINDRLGAALEGGVGIMLMLLGGHVLWRLWSGRIHWHAHSHDGRSLHLHAHSHAGEQEPHATLDHAHAHKSGPTWRTFAVGLMHGMAGSGALVVLTAATIDEPLLGLGYIVLFGIGSMLGMAAFSAAVALPLTFTARRLVAANTAIQAVTGIATLALGVATAAEAGAALLA